MIQAIVLANCCYVVDAFMYKRCYYKLSKCKTALMYLFADSARACTRKATYPGAIFGSCRREKVWQIEAKRFERGTLKRSGCSGLPVKPGNISAVETNCVIYSTSKIARSRIRDFSPFWRNKATKMRLRPLHYTLVRYHGDTIFRQL